MANLASKKSNFITNYATNVSTLLDTFQKLRNLRLDWDSEGYSSGIVDADFTGTNVYMTAAILTSAVVSAQALTDLLGANGNAHNTNLFKMIP